MMGQEEIESYVKAGQIACKILRDSTKIVRPGAKVIEIAEQIEKRIAEMGGEPAFPVNISINDVAAHYTPEAGDTLTVPEGAVVKIDIGVHVNGYIADTAITVALDDRYNMLCEAAKTALEKAVEAANIGTKFSEVGHIVESVIKSYGFKPIYNLSGHSLDRFSIHAGEVIPNYRDRLVLGSFKAGRAYAIEPFATSGDGYVTEGRKTLIYALRPNPKKLSKLGQELQTVFNTIYDDRKTLPFALRWYTNRFSLELLEKAVKAFVQSGLAIAYPVLVERSGGVVAQFEHTILFTDKGEKIVTTECLMQPT
ncbi:MAG: type II methionyl aminopeptidase [Ignisphaera sp.]